MTKCFYCKQRFRLQEYINVSVMCRIDKDHCFASTEFMAEGDEQSAVFIVACPARAENSSVGSTLHICYTHNDPSKEPLLTGPKSFLPLDNSLGATWRHCSRISHAKAMQCSRSLPGVRWCMLGILFLPAAFFIIVPCLYSLMHLILLCKAFLRSLKGKRAVIPDTSLEITAGQV